MSYKSDLADVEVEFQHQTDGAICVRDANDEDVWIPKSQCVIDPTKPKRGDIVELTASERVLIDRGLV